MTEHRETHTTHGMTDHHHVKAAHGFTFDPNYQADPETIQTVWDILQGKTKPTTEAPLQPGQIEVMVPQDYVQAIAFFCLRELKRRGCGSGFSVKASIEAPEVEIAWVRPGGLATPNGNGFAQTTDCLAAHLAQLDPQHVGYAAVEMFCLRLEEAMNAPGSN